MSIKQRYISVENGVEFSWPVAPDGNTTRLVIGSLAAGGPSTLPAGFTEGRLKTDFPNLRCLHLWNVDLETLGNLPRGLTDLDLQKCPRLTTLMDLPQQELEVLVLKDCPQLHELPRVDEFPALEELELNGGKRVPEEWLHALLAKAPKLWKLDLSGCEKVTRLSFYSALEDFRARGCSRLKALPDRWPASLRRLELTGTPLERIPEFHKALDYVDLTGMRKLLSLGSQLGSRALENAFPTSLFLHGSGVRRPPAATHGDGVESNVAEVVRDYFSDARTVGYGSVRRCKLLFLGNGQAGKTSLSLALEGVKRPAATAKEEGSTHGVRLRSLILEPTQGSSTAPIRVDHWDFGGQEIYHNTHRKFIQNGALFLNLWHRDQDGKKFAICPKTGYRDILRPLRYWLDLVDQATLGQGKGLIVASHQPELTEGVIQEKGEQCTGYDELLLMACDLDTGEGQLADIQKWVEDSCVTLIEAEGQDVPRHWEIAETMVTEWVGELSQDRDNQQVSQEMSVEEFQKCLIKKIHEVTSPASDLTREYEDLRVALEEGGDFRIDEKRTLQVLTFLTNIGAVYWSPDLFNKRVIIGQAWALQGIYAVLDRREESKEVYQKLDAEKGRFTRELLNELVWAKQADYKDIEVQKLLISFMLDCQVCFRLSSRERFYQEPIYVSLVHLPSQTALGLRDQFRTHCGLNLNLRPDAVITNPYLHESHWHAILARLGNAYGDAAHYARDGFLLLDNDAGQSVLLKVEISEAGIGGKIWVEVSGPDSDKLKVEMVEVLVKNLPDSETGRMLHFEKGELKLAGDLTQKVKLFISYARNNDPAKSVDRFDYEQSVNRIEKALLGARRNISIIRDRNEIKDGTHIPKFMEEAAKADHVLIVHSSKYWKSEYCLYEAWKSEKYTEDSTQTKKEKFLFLDLSSAEGKKLTDDEVETHWEAFKDRQISTGLTSSTDARTLSRKALGFYLDTYGGLAGHESQRAVWEPTKLDEIIQWIVSRCGFKVDESGD